MYVEKICISYKLLKRQPNLPLLSALELEAVSLRRANQKQQPHPITKPELEKRISLLEQEFLRAA